MTEKYSKLLSKNPIAAFDKIKENYVRYFKTMYKFNDTDLDDRKNAELLDESKDNLYKEPYLEILPEYELAKVNGETITDLSDLVSSLSPGFDNETDADDYVKSFIKKGLMDYAPYGHQVEMLKAGFLNEKNCVITSGTGSGKTEAFLLPLFAELYKEAKTWGIPAYKEGRWYEGFNPDGDSYDEAFQRQGENRPAAVRALIMYPMNALVEDQMTRLRKALDSDEVRDHFDASDGLKGNRIYFGRYNGSTIGKKSLQTASKQQKKYCRNSLNEIHNQSRHIKTYLRGVDAEEDAKYISPRLSAEGRTGEMITRWDMQEFPPDILISNFSMLSIILMREAEESIFNKTKEWLQKDGNVFHLVIDELHLFRGTAGSETAYLIRMLYDALGLSPFEEVEGEKVPNKKIRIYASSASLGNTEDQTLNFLEEFFGVFDTSGDKTFHVQNGTDYAPKKTNEVNYNEFERIPSDYLLLDEDEKQSIRNVLANKLGCDSLNDFFEKNAESIFADFIKVVNVNDGNGKSHPEPKSLTYFKEKLFNNNEAALNGFLVIRADDEFNNIRLPRIRFHQFFKYIEGLWAELLPQKGGNNSQSPFGELMYRPHQSVQRDDSLHKVLELLRCEGCGEPFIGGNAKRSEDSIKLSLNSPELDKIPNRNPTPMVQNKLFNNYAVFWPTTLEQNDPDSNFWCLKPDMNRDDFECTDVDGNTTYNLTKNRGNWQKASLNALTGEVKNTWNTNEVESIKGYLYNLIPHLNNRNNNNRTVGLGDKVDSAGSPYLIKALPNKCPSCARDYVSRKYTDSPIRNFRTGIARSNQLLSKELMYQLSGNKPKLVGFSDSRQDAADQAYGIEKEHYRDMLRALFLECIEELTSVDPKIKKLIDKTLELQGGVFKIIDDEFSNIENRMEIAVNVLSGNYDQYIHPEKHINLSQLVVDSEGVFNGLLLQKLLKLGINPAGVEYGKQSYNGIHWSKFYHFGDNGHWAQKSITDIRALINNRSQREEIFSVPNYLYAGIFENSFGRYMSLDINSSGLGFLCFKINAEDQNQLISIKSLLPPSIDVEEFLNAFLRVLGDHYRYDNPDFDISIVPTYNRLQSSIRRAVTHFCNKYTQITANDLIFELEVYLHSKFGATNILIKPQQLVFCRAVKDDTYFECPSCSKIHLHKGFGFCTNTQCLTDLIESSNKVEHLYSSFISHDLLKEKRAPMRLRTEELTGQTDNQSARQLEFKGIIVDNASQVASQLSKEIDMINVTTTMEVGIDIGSLEAIFQGNMPPTRYNYQQRVGRGGRRGQAYSCAVTFCRGKSHDTYYYHSAIDKMLGELPPAPTLAIAPIDVSGESIIKTSIVKRILTKNILKLAFKEISHKAQDDYIANGGDEIPNFSDTHGEFGHMLLWGYVKPLLRSWLDENHVKIDSYVDKYLLQFNLNNEIVQDLDQIKNWFKNTLINQLQNAYDKKTSNEGLAQIFAEAGILPMFGMPSGVRELFHGVDVDRKELRSINRPVEQSITEFAPGAIKTKDKGFYESVGLTIPLSYSRIMGNRYGVNSMDRYDPDNPNPNKFDALEYSFSLNKMGNEIVGITDDFEVPQPQLNESGAQVDDDLPIVTRLVVPKAFRTEKLNGNVGAAGDNTDTKGSFSSSVIYAKENGVSDSKDLGNAKIHLFGGNEGSMSEIWHINDNNGNYFSGHSVDGTFMPDYRTQLNIEPTIRNGAGVTFSPNFIMDKYFQGHGNNQFSGNIALGVKKATEMIKIEIKTIPAEICLNINDASNKNSTEIKAAFYSAAFILQRALANDLDINPGEIEISELQIDPATGVPYLYLSDSLPNGSGFVSFLALESRKNDVLKTNIEWLIEDVIAGTHPFIESVFAKKHSDKCRTSCQECLNTYDNAGYHHVLDWRLGVGLLRLMVNENYKFGVDSDTSYPELNDLVEILGYASKTYSKSSNQDVMTSESGLNYIRSRDVFSPNQFECVIHPLWNLNYIKNNIINFLPEVNISRYETYFKHMR